MRMRKSKCCVVVHTPYVRKIRWLNFFCDTRKLQGEVSIISTRKRVHRRMCMPSAPMIMRIRVLKKAIAIASKSFQFPAYFVVHVGCFAKHTLCI